LAHTAGTPPYLFCVGCTLLPEVEKGKESVNIRRMQEYNVLIEVLKADVTPSMIHQGNTRLSLQLNLPWYISLYPFQMETHNHWGEQQGERMVGDFVQKCMSFHQENV
jgi:hypothetical protein